MTAWLFWIFVAIIVYVYAGYPLLLAFLARLRPCRRWDLSKTPEVTLLIAAHNEEKVIEAKLANSLELDYPRERLQIIVAADGSDDRTAGIVSSFAGRGVELNHIPERRGKAAAINRAMPLASGEIVVLSDANNLYARDSLRQLTAPFSDASVGAVSGAKTIAGGDGSLGASEGLYWRYESFIKRQETRLGTCTGMCGEILAVRRSLFEPLPQRVITDDFYIGMRVIKRGYRVVYAPGARSVEKASPSAQDEVERRARNVAGRLQSIAMARELLPKSPLIGWQVISHKFGRLLLPLAMIGALTANVIAVLRPAETGGRALLHLAYPYNWILLGAQAAFYGIATLPMAGIKPGGKAGRLMYLPCFLLDSNVAALVGLFRYATGKQSVAWKRVPRA